MQAPNYSPRHLAARTYATEGMPVFPCVVNGKEPATAHGLKDATIDLAVIDAWWSEADYNVALCPDDCGWLVVDLDTPKQKKDGTWTEDGRETWAKLQAEHGAAESYTVTSPRGGRHIYYEGSGRSTVQSALGPGVDSRGVGGYVLLPPSVVDGKPYVANNAEIEPLPAWVSNMLATSVREAREVTTDLDAPASIDRVKRLLASAAPAVEGEGGDDATYRLACRVRELGVSEETANDLMATWNERCEPPWEPDELADKIAHAYDYAQNGEGAWAVEAASSMFGGYAPPADEKPAPSKWKLYFPKDQDAWPEPEWLIPGLLPKQGLAMIYGKPGTWKTFAALDLTLGLAAGLPTWGSSAAAPAPVLYLAGESPRGIGKSRRPAWQIFRGVERVALDETFAIGPDMPKAYDPLQVRDMVEAVQATGYAPKIVVVDTLARFAAGLDENAAKDMGNAVEALDFIAKAFDCLVLVLHHAGANTDRVRGSSVIEGAFDTMIEAERFKGLPALALWVRKQKDAPERAQPLTFEVRSFGGSAVLSPTTPEEHARLVESPDAISQAKVGAALVKLGAMSLQASVSAHVVANELLPPNEVEGVEERQEAIEAMARLLKRRARKDLSAYVDGDKWRIPVVS